MNDDIKCLSTESCATNSSFKDDDVSNYGHHREQHQQQEHEVYNDDSDHEIRRQSRSSFKMIDPVGYMLPVIHQAVNDADEDETEQ